MTEVIPNDIAAKILKMSRQYMYDEMSAGRLNIGHIKRSKKRSGHNQYYVYRAKLAAHLGRPADHQWPEECDG